jgi:F-type H+-transporting ATPase subunit delta
MAQEHSAQQSSEAADNDTQGVAGVYAKALLGAAGASGSTEAVLGEFDSLVSDVLDAFPHFEAVLVSAMIAADRKIEVIDRTLAKQASPLMLSFLKVLAEHGRLDLLRPIRRVAHQMVEEMSGRVRVEVTTAAPLDEQSTARTIEKLRRMLGREPQLQQRVDPNIIGGLVLRVGDTIFDGSVNTRLARMRDQIIQRSVHEIQRRRDLVSHPAGN